MKVSEKGGRVWQQDKVALAARWGKLDLQQRSSTCRGASGHLSEARRETKTQRKRMKERESNAETDQMDETHTHLSFN